jgi:hypothetical protein
VTQLDLPGSYYRMRRFAGILLRIDQPLLLIIVASPLAVCGSKGFLVSACPGAAG